MSRFAIHWTSYAPHQLAGIKPKHGNAECITGTHVAANRDELIGFLLALPGDGTMIVRAVAVVE